MLYFRCRNMRQSGKILGRGHLLYCPQPNYWGTCPPVSARTVSGEGQLMWKSPVSQTVTRRCQQSQSMVVTRAKDVKPACSVRRRSVCVVGGPRSCSDDVSLLASYGTAALHRRAHLQLLQPSDCCSLQQWRHCDDDDDDDVSRMLVHVHSAAVFDTAAAKDLICTATQR